MNWNEIEAAWQAQLPQFSPPAWSLAEFEDQRRRLARRLAWRDWSEAGASLVVAGVFGATLWLFAADDWRGWLAVVILLGIAVKFARERRRAARARVQPEASLLVQLEAEIAELRHQRRLLQDVARWYLLPIMAAMALFGWALVRSIAAAGVAVEWSPLMLIGLASLALAAGVWWLNRFTVRTWIEPQLAARERAREELSRA